MKYLLVVPVLLVLAGCTYSLVSGPSAQGEANNQSVGEETIGDSALSELGLENVLAPPGIPSSAGTAATPESTLFSANTQAVNPLSPTSIPTATVNGGPIQGFSPAPPGGFSPTLPTFGPDPNLPSFGSAGPGSGAGAAAGNAGSF